MHPTNSVAFFDYLGNLAMPPAPMQTTLRQFNIRFVETESLLIPTHSISTRHTSQNLEQIQMWGIPAERRTLAVLETRVNDPFPFSQKAARAYGSIIFASHYHTQESEHFGWPWISPLLHLTTDRRNRIVMMNANKFSSANGEQYSFRRAILRELVLQRLPVDLYGSHWTQSRTQNILQSLRHDAVHLRDQIRLRQKLSFSHSRYRSLNTQLFPSLGETENKFETLNQYRYSLVIENDLTSFTEKLMDSLACGCTTFYLGPKPTAIDGLPGVVLLPESPTTAVNLIRNYLSESDETVNNAQVIRDAAVNAFAQTAGKAWENLAKRWLTSLSDTQIQPE